MGHDSPASQTAPAERKIDYPLGTSDFERERLIRQAAKLRPMTEDTFRAAGVAPGMRVLDVGCGAGDVAMLAAELVGPSGKVLAIDRDPHNLAFARERAVASGLRHIEFREADLAQFSDSQPFDALVGRYILLFVSDRIAALRNLLRSVRSGGAVVFIEPDFTLSFHSVPHAPLFSQVTAWFRALNVATGTNLNSGTALHANFREAGLTHIQMESRQWVGGGPHTNVFSLFVDVMRSMSPAIIARGIAAAEQLEIDTLEQRLLEENAALGGIVFSYFNIAAWARKP